MPQQPNDLLTQLATLRAQLTTLDAHALWMPDGLGSYLQDVNAILDSVLAILDALVTHLPVLADAAQGSDALTVNKHVPPRS